MAISVDDQALLDRQSQRDEIPFKLLGDPELRLVDALKIRNPEVPIALHSVYIADEEGRIYYRKVGRRRPLPGELLDAIDFHRGRWPRPAVVVEEGDLSGYHMQISTALSRVVSQTTFPAGLTQEQKKRFGSIKADIQKGEYDLAIHSWMTWTSEEDLPFKDMTRFLAWDLHVRDNEVIQELARWSLSLDMGEREKRVRSRVRNLPDEDRDAVFRIRALLSIFGDVVDAQASKP